MDISKILAELRSERTQIDEAIIALEHLARGSGKRRGRPPKWLSEVKPDGPPQRGSRKKRTISPEARARMAEAQKRRWEAARAAQAARG